MIILKDVTIRNVNGSLHFTGNTWVGNYFVVCSQKQLFPYAKSTSGKGKMKHMRKHILPNDFLSGEILLSWSFLIK